MVEGYNFRLLYYTFGRPGHYVRCGFFLVFGGFREKGDLVRRVEVYSMERMFSIYTQLRRCVSNAVFIIFIMPKSPTSPPLPSPLLSPPPQHATPSPILLHKPAMKLLNPPHPLRARRQKRSSKMGRALFLSKATSRNNAYACSVQETGAVESIGGAVFGLRGGDGARGEVDGGEEVH